MFDRFLERRTYRRELRRALKHQRRTGMITVHNYHRIRAATADSSFMELFIDEVKNAARVAGDFMDDVRAWLKRLFDWLVENWEVVLRISITLLMFL